MHISLVDWVLIGVALACAASQGIILRILQVRNLGRQYPAFFRYNIFCIASYALTLGPYIYYCREYFYLFWVLNVFLMGLEFFVMYEALVAALKPYSALIDLGKMIFRWAALFLLLAALLTAIATNGPENSRIVAAVNLMQRSLRLMQCGLLLLFFSFEQRLGLSWRSHSMSLALGLGVYATADLSFSYLSVHFATSAQAFGIMGNLIYLAATGYWAYCLANPEPVRKNVLDSPSKLIFQRWNDALVSSPFVAQGNQAIAHSESFLPSVERTVERVMARKMTN